MNKVTQKIYDLPIGHLAIELLREHNGLMLDVDDEAIQVCKNGAEVTLGDPLMRSQMLEAPTVHGTHHVAWPPSSDAASPQAPTETPDGEGTDGDMFQFV